MTQNEQRTATPPLRFPEFRKDPPWPETPLNAVLFEHGEKNDGKSEVHSVSVHKGVVNQVEHLGRSFAAADRSNYNLAKPHDIIYTKSPTGGFPYGIIKQNRLPYNVIVSPLYGVFSPINRYLGYLLDAYFESPFRTNAYLAPIIQKGAKNTIQISNARFLSKGLYLPPSEAEHKKIAECLSTLDELIEVESRKLDALKDHKKGLMQQLFPREGETRPRLRFPEFCNAPEWTARRLGDACSLQAGMFVRASEIKDQYEVGLYPCYGGNGLRGYTATFTHDGAFPLVGRQGALCGNVKFCTGKFHATEHALVATPKTGIDVKWLYYALDFLNLNRFATGQAQPGLSVDVLEKVHFSAPDKVDEQHRIAACLSSLDDLIAAQSEKLKALRTHKRGLMQQLFPSPDAIDP